MDLLNYYGRLYEVIKRETVEGEICQHITLKECEPVSSPFCPYCDIGGIGRVHNRVERTVYDIYDNKPAKIIIKNRSRYICTSCRRTFYSDPIAAKAKKNIMPNYIEHIIKDILTHPADSFPAIAKSYGISPATLNTAINAVIEQNVQKIKSVMPCDWLCFYPMNYDGINRCFVMGKAEHNNDKILLDILEHYDVESIREFERKKFYFSGQVGHVACAIDDALVCELKKIFPEAAISFVPACIEKFVKSFLRRGGTGAKKDEHKAFESLKLLLSKCTSETFYEKFDAWKVHLDPFEDEYIFNLRAEVGKNHDEWGNTADYIEDDSEYDYFMEIVQKFKNNKVPFKTMKYRLMFACSNAYGTSSDGNGYIGRFDFATIAQLKVYHYGVWLDDIIRYFDD